MEQEPPGRPTDRQPSAASRHMPRLVPRLVSTALVMTPFAATLPPVGQPGCGDAARLLVQPERPRQGTLFRLRAVDLPDSATLHGTVAGEPLHFSPDGTGALQALAPAPIDATSPLRIVVACTAGGRTDSLRASPSLASGGYPVEKLRVAPRFSAPPDSALAARMRRESALAAAVSATSHDTPRLWELPFRAPRPSRVTSRFGRGREFNGTVTSRHMGTDYAGAVGAPIRAANRGVVRLVDSFFLGGNVVYLDHGQGLVTAYLHLSEHAVAVGDTVQRGEVIGRVGATGRVTGPHLHWITRYGGVTVDPASVLDLTAAAGDR
jgi:murein DD-endopeptidase MepM/ murein hydrolase activator NlpD